MSAFTNLDQKKQWRQTMKKGANCIELFYLNYDYLRSTYKQACPPECTMNRLDVHVHLTLVSHKQSITNHQVFFSTTVLKYSVDIQHGFS